MNDSIKNKKWGGGGWEEVHSLYTANYTVSHSGPACPKKFRIFHCERNTGFDSGIPF